jgi:chorismate mutase
MKTKIFFATCLLIAALAAPGRMMAQKVKVEKEKKEVVIDTAKVETKGDVGDYSKEINEITKEITRLTMERQKLQQEMAEKKMADKNDPAIDDLQERIEKLNDQIDDQSDRLEDAVAKMQEDIQDKYGDYSYNYEYKYDNESDDNDGDTTVSTNTEDSNQIVIRISDKGISWKKDGKEEMMKNKKHHEKKDLPKYKTQLLGLDLGVNAFAQKLNGSASAERDPMALDVAKSLDVTLHIFRQGISLYHNYLYLTMGLDADFHNFRLDKDINLVPETDSFKYTVLPENLKRNKLEANYLNIPVMLNLESNPRNPNRSFKLGFGGFAGVRYSSYTKQVTTEGKKTKYHDDFNLNPIDYGVRGQIGYGPFTVYSQYTVSPFFTAGHQAPELNPVTFGIVLNGFKWKQ